MIEQEEKLTDFQIEMKARKRLQQIESDKNLERHQIYKKMKRDGWRPLSYEQFLDMKPNDLRNFRKSDGYHELDSYHWNNDEIVWQFKYKILNLITRRETVHLFNFYPESRVRLWIKSK